MSGATLARFDPGLVELRAAGVTMVATLASFFSVWLVEGPAGLHGDVVVLAVALAVSLGRTQRRSDHRSRMLGAVLVPVVAAGAGQIGAVMGAHAAIGDTLFAAAVAAGIWVRRFGPIYAKAGTQATLPFIAVLIAPAPTDSGLRHALWTAAAAAIAVAWVTLTQLLAQRAGVLAKPVRAPALTPRTPSTAPRWFAPGSWPASTRMALQMGAGLAGAFVLAHQLYPQHWSWTVLTAYIVASGNRGRGDVIHKGGQRVLGAAGGTIIATLLASTFPAGDRWAIVALFAVLALASWLRSVSYLYWAGGVTAALAFLYGYYGETGTTLLWTRLAGIILGATIAVAAAWVILPIKTNDVLRRRVADALAGLTDYLAAAGRRDLSQLIGHQARFDHAIAQLDQLAAPLTAHRRINPTRHRDGHPVDAITALRACQKPIHTLTQRASADPHLLAQADISDDLTVLQTAVTTARHAMAHTSTRSPETDSPSARFLTRRGPDRSSALDPRALSDLPLILTRITDASRSACG